ncbi:hypothetical protein vBBceHLY2_00143 [Bacillus phage vB_BceH_LY2]|nr:hypothetical protein vBBceHLY2_00143 [Bacillus phage vB_BceH_LY2]
MTRHTRSKQLIKLAMMQGDDVKFAKWNYEPGHNLTIEASIEESNKWDKVIDTSFQWMRKGNEDNKRDHSYIVYKEFTMRKKLKEGVRWKSLDPNDYEELPYWQYKLINTHTYR